MQPDEDEARRSGQEPGDSAANAAGARGETPSDRDASHDQRRIGAADREAKRADGLRAAVLVFARSRLAPLSADDVAAITALTDEGELTELVDTLAQVSSVEEARAVLAAAIAGMRK